MTALEQRIFGILQCKGEQYTTVKKRFPAKQTQHTPHNSLYQNFLDELGVGNDVGKVFE